MNNWRPEYEREKDRVNEQLVAEKISAVWGLTANKMPRMYHLDFVLQDSVKRLRGFAEIKARNNKRDRYTTYMIGLSKVMAARKLTEVTKLGCILVVKWEDQIGWINFTDHESFGLGGRTDRGDSQDIEPVAYFDITRFKGL